MRAVRGFVAVAVLASALVACGSDQPASTGTSEPPKPAPTGTSEPPKPAPTAASEPQEPSVDLPLRFGALTERSVDGGADGQNTTAAVAGINAFAIDLYNALQATNPGNLVVSPYSAAFALSMIYAGARGATATEMAGVLHADTLPAEGWHEGINAYDMTLDARTAGSPTKWASANKVWTMPGLALRPEFLDVLTGSYGSPLAEADFAGDAEAQRALINEWVAEQTDAMIEELFPSQSLDPSTVMVLVNAVSMDAPWEFPFDPAATTQAPFTRADGSVVQVPTMHYDEYLPSVWTEGYQAVELPYGDGALSMVVIAPTDLAAFEASLTLASLDSVISSIDDGGIHLSMPKWSNRTHFTLNATLAAMGMPTAFGGGADFSGMVDGGGIWIDRVEHEAFVEVDEQGTRAAAATGGAMAASHGPTIEINRPFLYLIRDRGAGTILFIGRVTDPTAT